MQPTLSQPLTDDDNNNRRKKSISGDSFSFPSTPNNDSDFEFGSLTPDSPSSDPCKTSPADHLFFNGRLQPHSFPVVMFHRPIGAGAITTSRTSSISSKGSLVSSRSNSTNSRSSCSSSARTSSSDTSERKLFHNKVSSLTSSSSSYGKGASCNNMVNNNRSKVLSQHNYAYGSSKRWQYITPAPVLSRDASKRSRKGDMKQGKKKKKKKKMVEKGSGGMRLRFGGRILRWFVMACRECHAMEPSKAKNKEIKEQKNKCE
ncbi:hypothetical protein RIF29_30995 [Crotalaria pallida]|uniref:Uncharacterized protein n=1 Tax=Crotalaria pallida TaxID=3830 RepID=A0AAN9I1K9_CROPI